MHGCVQVKLLEQELEAVMEDVTTPEEEGEEEAGPPLPAKQSGASSPSKHPVSSSSS